MSRMARMIATMLLLANLVGTAGCTTAPADDAKKTRGLVQSDIAQVMADIRSAEAEDFRIGLSSNPYDYVGISPAFERLVSRGEPALDAIATEIEASPDNGLREYLLGIAGESILGDTKDDVPWSSGKEWARAYRDRQ